MAQTNEQLKIDRLDLQRTQSAVLVKVDGVEYALVGDDNFFGNDPYWWQMYEAPTFIYTPSGPPIAVGGSANAKKVNVGGKIGVVKDPFGDAQYLGATLPLDGYGVHNLGLSEDGTGSYGFAIAGTYTQTIHSCDYFVATQTVTVVYDEVTNTYGEPKIGDITYNTAGKKKPTPDNAAAIEQEKAKAIEASAAISSSTWQVAIEAAKRDAKAKYDKAVDETRRFEPAKFGADGILEVDSSAAGGNGRKTLGWLNAYNAPHWMDFSSMLKTNGTLASGWVDKVDAGKSTQGSSWIYDTMLLGQDAAVKQGRTKDDQKLWFKDTGEIGAMLNLGINEKYVSKDNQSRVAGKDVILGLTPDTPPGFISDANKADYQNKLWNAANAQALAGMLRNPNIDNSYDATNKIFGSKTDNAQGANQQGDTLKDFLAVYSATLTDNQAGNGVGWDDIKIASSGDKTKIKEALFGNGIQIGGLIDPNDVLLGGTASPLGGAMSAESLAKFMGRPNAVSDYLDWVKPLQDALVEFDIVTPQRIAAFLAQVRAESGGMTKLREQFVFNDDVQVSIKKILESAPVSATNLWSAWRFKPGRTSDAYNATNRTELENAKAWFKEVIVRDTLGIDINNLTPQVMEQKITWSEEIREKIANRVYSSDKGNPNGNGTESSGDGFKYIGYGLKQVTGKSNLLRFAQYVENAGDKSLADSIKQTPWLLSTDKSLAARSAAHFWSVNKSKVYPGSGLSTGRTLNGEADRLTWGMPIPAGDEVIINYISRGIATDYDSFPSRWSNYSNRIAPQALQGGNPYDDVRSVLARLGIQTRPREIYKSQFGMVLKAPKPLALLAEHLNAQSISNESSVVQLIGETVVDAQLALGIDRRDIDMWLAEPPSEPNEAPLAIYLATSNSIQISEAHMRVMGVCQALSSNAYSKDNAFEFVAPLAAFSSYLLKYENVDAIKTVDDLNAVEYKVIKEPSNGKLIIEKGVPIAFYPNEDYEGKEFFIIEVRKGALRVQVHYFLQVSTLVRPTCPQMPKGADGWWKISNFLIEEGFNDWLSSLPHDQQFGDHNFNGVQLGFAFLEPNVLGETFEAFPNTRITLDTTAAGHGWYIDYTPYLNDEYLPTSNPLEWIAKPGSEAEGKMDLLTVLLHEYGHALGLDHSTDNHDLMANTLLPGVRRLPSAEELNLMAQLLGVAQETGSASPVPYDPFSPPGTPLPTTISLAAFVAARQRRSTLSSALTQFEVAANPTLTNPQFADSQGWSSGGDVAIAAGAATLKETATAQTRLNQAFVVGPNDRFLSFTLSGIALDDVSNAPDDAFEVALIDANTGLSLLGGTGLTHNDAFLNLQADGTEYKASGVTTVKNADGSRMVLVDLAGIAVGTVVNLSFDLIGFGKGAAATSSHVTVRDLRLGVPQEARDDTATLDEDATLDIDVVANDVGADQAGVKPVLVSGPAHGTVEITPDGRFRYQPAANWSGEDSFSYRLSDGNLESNIAEVKLTVTPVNDAPVPTGTAVTLSSMKSATAISSPAAWLRWSSRRSTMRR